MNFHLDAKKRVLSNVIRQGNVLSTMHAREGLDG
jgi:hypothetical protein